MYSGASGQDWEVVKFAKQQSQNAPKQQVIRHPKNSSTDHKAINAAKIEKETEDFHIERVTPYLSKSIIKARTSAKLTQAQLAQKIFQPLKVVQEYENGKATPNNQIIQKMSRALGTTLKLRES
jgi:putative transcription factor